MPRAKKMCAENTIMRELIQKKKAELITYSKRQDYELNRINDIFKRRADLRMVVIDLACGHHWIDKMTGGRIWTRDHSAALVGEADAKNHQSGKLLCEVKELFIHDLCWYAHDLGENRARIIYSCSIPEKIQKIIHSEEFSEDRLFVLNRKKASERKIIEADKEILTTLENVHRQYWQLDYFAKCMSETPIEMYLDLRRKNGIATIKMAKAMGDQQQIALAKALYDRPRPYAIDTETVNEILARLYVTEHGTINRTLRRRFYKGHNELDAKSFHFATLAMKYPQLMPETVRFLQESLKNDDLSLWNEVMNHLQIPEEQQEKAKDIIKPSTYSIQYGREAEYAQQLLFDQMRGAISWRGSYLECIYIQELVTATRQCMTDIEKYGGMQGAFGWIAWDRTKMNIRSFMANVFQSFEIAAMYPIYELYTEQKVMGMPSFHILLHQHDGLTPAFATGQEERVFALMQQRFDRVMGDYGIITKLVLK